MTRSDSSKVYTYSWFINRFKRAREQAFHFLEPIGEDLFIRRPNRKVWSVGECYDHLNIFGNRYMESIRYGMERGSTGSAESGQSFKPGLITRGVVKFFNPPYKLKIKTLKPFKPQSGASIDKETVLNRFTALQDSLIRTVQEARDKRYDLDKCNTSHPLFNWVKMTVTECYAIVEVHQRRHMWQAEQVMKHLS